MVSPLDAADKPAARGAPAHPPAGRRDRLRGSRDRQSVVELATGAALVVVVAAVGLGVAHRTVAVPVDRWILDLVPAGGGGWFTRVTWLRYPAVTLAGSAVAAAVVFRRDRLRAAACLIGPAVALITSELLVKPAVGRTLGGVYSYPSGSTVGAAALATVAVLAAPPRWRTATVVVAAVFSLWMSAAVVSLHWHYPTDALAGLAYGAGVVLLADGSAGRITVRMGRRRRRGLRAAEEVRPEDRRPADG